MLVEMLPAALELVTDESDAVQPNTHGELLIFFLHFAVTGAFLCQRLMVQGERQHDICPDFPGMERAVEAPKLYRMVAMEEAVQIEKMIAAGVVVAAAASRIVLIPNGFYLWERPWLYLVHPFYQNSVHFLAVTHPLRRNLQ